MQIKTIVNYVTRAMSSISKPFRKFEDMQMIRHTKTLGTVQVDEAVWKHLSADEKDEIKSICDEKLEAYFSRLSK